MNNSKTFKYDGWQDTIVFIVRLHSAAGVVARRARKMYNFKAVFTDTAQEIPNSLEWG